MKTEWHIIYFRQQIQIEIELTASCITHPEDEFVYSRRLCMW